MNTAWREMVPIALRRWLVTGLQEAHTSTCGQLMHCRVVVASSLAILVSFGAAALALQVDRPITRDIAVLAVPTSCIGDCNSDGAATVDEVLLLTNIALGEAEIGTCPTADVNLDGQITIDEIIAAVNSALNGCPVQPGTPSPVATSTPVTIPTSTPSSAPTGAATATPTPTSPASLGPQITYFGLAGQDWVPLAPTPGANGQPDIYTNPPFANGKSIVIVVEAGLGGSGALPGTMTINSNPAGRPDLQIEADQPLGDGSTLVCDAAPIPPPPTPTITPGGVPAINATTTDPQYITDALNDFGCRFEVRLTSDDACTQPTPQIARFVNKDAGSQRQYCTHEATKQELAFHTGDTLLTVRVRDVNGNLGDPKSILVRVP